MEYDNEQLTDKNPCAGVRADLKKCLLISDCCRVVSLLIFKFFPYIQPVYNIYLLYV